MVTMILYSLMGERGARRKGNGREKAEEKEKRRREGGI